MCLLAWNWQPNDPERLLLIGNRDEFYARPTQALHWWKDHQLLAGQDLQAGGTWLGVAPNGKLAVLTNYRDPANHRFDAPSRGHLVSDFLIHDHSIASYLQHLSQVSQVYNPFNLLLFDGQQLKGFQSRNASVVDITPGIGGVSNADFNTPWPKLTTLTQQLHARVLQGNTNLAHCFDLLQNTQQASDSQLPTTGLALERERALSACFIRTPEYGTRASSVVRFSHQHVTFAEQNFNAQGATLFTQFDFSI
jgi:uncharacterized protein with NRDE domain